MSDDEARANGLYLVIGLDGTPTSDSPVETVERARRMVGDLAAMVRKTLRDGVNPYRLLHIREALGELHVDMDMLGEELTGREFTTVITVEHPADTAETAAKLADELAATVNDVLDAGFNWHRLNDVFVGLAVMGEDFDELIATLRCSDAGDRGAA